VKTFPVMTCAQLSSCARKITDDATRYENFIVKAQSFGLTVEQAKAIFEHEGLYVRPYEDVFKRSERRLDAFAENGYLLVTLSEVLTRDELLRARFSAETPLNDWRSMPDPVGKRFADLNREEQRELVLAAIELAVEQRFSLERAVSLVTQAHLLMWDLASG